MPDTTVTGASAPDDELGAADDDGPRTGGARWAGDSKNGTVAAWSRASRALPGDVSMGDVSMGDDTGAGAVTVVSDVGDDVTGFGGEGLTSAALGA